MHTTRLFPLRLLAAFVLVAVALTSVALADEGMWLPYRLDQAPFTEWQRKGLMLGQGQMWSPEGPDVCDAIVQLGGGTGSFVSSDGLIVTNHHVAFGALQRQSSVEVNIMADGFLARSRAEEIPAPGYNAYVLENVEDVTKKVLGRVKAKMSDLERFRAIDKAKKSLIEKAEKGKDVRVEVAEFFGGSTYYMLTYFKIKDVRIVYAPPATIGIYGGEIDNWMWPRHTGDFSFLRAYVAPDGKSAEYAEDNVPYKPRHHLPFSIAPLSEGDFTMVIGYPGRTQRNRVSYGIDYYINQYYPNRVTQYGDLIELLEARSAESDDAAIKVASTLRSLANSFKNSQGQLEGLTKHGLVGIKQAEEKAIRAYLAEHPDAQKEFGTVLDDMAARWKDYAVFGEQYNALLRMMYFTSGLRSAYTIAKWANEHEKKDLDRDQGYQDRDEDSVKRRLSLADRRYDEAADKTIFGYYMNWLVQTSGDEQLEVVQVATGGTTGAAREAAIAEFLDRLYAGTKVTDMEARMAMFGQSKKKLMQAGDPMIEFAMTLVEETDRLKDRSDALAGAMTRLRPQMIELRRRVSDAPAYADANRTMRVSVGSIEGYEPKDAVVYKPFTRLSGMVAKHTGEEPFDCPEKLAALHRARDYGPYADSRLNDMPVCFLSTDDITGGNSGSPVLNGRGEIIGLAFDGNYESISADYQIIPELTRSIHVDSRYVLFVVDKFAGATELLSELTIVGAEGAMR